ncbi:chaplin family protein [Nocardiopsis aegyptia]|uniref:chaplin family protein n=1 Tax=Nocardiopsis aegyptia TaxID=220378 RepID=UPI00366D74DA
MLKKALAASAITAAAAGVLFTGTPAMANSNVFTSGNGSILGGNQLVADLDVPVNVCGNAIAVLGVAGANCTDSGATVKNW